MITIKFKTIYTEEIWTFESIEMAMEFLSSLSQEELLNDNRN